MDRQTLYLTTLGLLITVATSALAALNETRLDVYVSMFTLVYFVANAVYRPRKRTRDFLALALLVVFAYIVANRVLEILLKP